MEFISEYPSWLILVCVAAGLLVAILLYSRDRSNRHFAKWLVYVLGTMRFIAVTLIALFLLKPLLKTVERTEEKPIIVIAQDASESIVLGGDSTFYRGQYLTDLAGLTSSLEELYDVRTYQFAEQVSEGHDSINYNGKLTDYSTLLEELYSKFSNRNLGAVILASDGVYNKGSNPLYTGTRLNVPFFTVAMGDSAQRKDLLVADVAYNRLAYLGNDFPVEILIQGRQAEGEKSRVRVVKAGTTLFNQEIQFDSNDFEEVIPLTIEATQTGLQKFSVVLESVDDEITTTNNRFDFFIDVLDSRQKILLLSSAPHPDLAALEQAISSNENYEVENVLADDFSGNIAEYNLVIFHQLPNAKRETLTLVNTAIDADIPALFVFGAQSNLNQFNALKLGYELSGFKGTLNEVHGTVNENFSLFKVDEGVGPLLRKLPPLHMPFGDFSYSPGVVSLVTQRIGLIETEAPLISFNKEGSAKVGLISGEGLWRWRLVSFLESGSHDEFDRIVSKSIQYLASKEDKSFFRVTGETNLLENQAVLFEAELYNESYELTTDPEVSMQITDEDDNQFSYTFSRAGSSYKLDAGRLPVGNYVYEARTSSNGVPRVERGEFSVSGLQLESTSTQANHQLLNQFAESTGGAMVQASELGQLPSRLAQMDQVTTISHESKVLSDLINTRWILIILAGLICLEWLLRKRSGTY